MDQSIEDVTKDIFVPWKILDVKVRNNDHVEAKVPNHPRARGGWVSYAKVLMENEIGRVLERGEVVFHIDRNSLNNELSNLKVVTQGELINIVRDHALNNDGFSHLKALEMRAKEERKEKMKEWNKK